ncbi:MAG: fimbria/pilus outer membrane usher protein [Bdellovibrionales bacterium]
MNPSKLTYPSGNYEIYLKQNSKVYIWVNDQMQKVLTLPAGRHEIKDFPYTNGVNNLRFEIVDEFGQSETLNYSYFSSSELLKEKLHQYAYAAGRPAIAAPLGGKEYNDNTTYTGFHRYGFNNYFTGGLNFQRDNYQTIVGGDALWSTKIGFVKIEPAVSLNTVSGNGLAVRTRYSYVDYKGPQKTQRLFNAGLTVQSPQFSTLGNLSTAGSKTLYGLSSSYTRGISKSMSANMGASYNINNKALAGVENSFLLTGGLSNRWENGISVNASASHTKSEGGKDDLGISLFLLWSFPEEKQVISAVKNTSDNSSRVDWNYSPSTGADSANYSATIRENDSEKGYAGLVSFNGNRARATVGHEVLLESANSSSAVTVDNQRAANITTLQVGSALVYTRGRFAIGRPITDSFAIVAPVKSLKGRRLEINPDSDENYVAKSDWLGPAVASELGSYNISSIVVAGRDLPVGISLPKDHFSIYPTYKSGYSFELGTDANIYLIGLVKLPDGKPASMIAGQAMNVDDPSQPPITLFTSRKGQIRSEGFRTGRFVLEVDTEKYEPLDFAIPESAKEEFDIGVLQLRVKGDRRQPEKAPVIEQKAEPQQTVEPQQNAVPVQNTEPAKTTEPQQTVEPQKILEPNKVVDPVKVEEPVKVDDPAKAVEQNEVIPEPKPATVVEPVPQATPQESPQDTNVPETNPVTSPESDIINEEGGAL